MSVNDLLRRRQRLEEAMRPAKRITIRRTIQIGLRSMVICAADEIEAMRLEMDAKENHFRERRVGRILSNQRQF
jgi:hypothetical protein